MLFLQAIRVPRPKDRTASLAALQDLTRGNPPVWARLMRGLRDLTVVDLSSQIAGPYATKLLADPAFVGLATGSLDAGAAVSLVERVRAVGRVRDVNTVSRPARRTSVRPNARRHARAGALRIVSPMMPTHAPPRSGLGICYRW